MMKTNRLPDTELANTIRKLQNEVDEKILILNALREQYSGNETIEWGEYIHSVAWEETRQKIFRRDGFRCVCCGASKNLNVHHITYDNLGAERPSDLVTLCQKCHEKVHNGDEFQTKIIGSTVKLGVPYGFNYDEWFLLVYANSMGQGYAGIGEEFELKPEYFESFYARRTIDTFNRGCFLDEKLEKTLHYFCEKVMKSHPYAVIHDMYFSLLLKVSDSFLTFKEETLVEDFALPFSDHESIKEELTNIEEFRNRIREKVGD